jgi:hypothetical protein
MREFIKGGQDGILSNEKVFLDFPSVMLSCWGLWNKPSSTVTVTAGDEMWQMIIKYTFSETGYGF